MTLKTKNYIAPLHEEPVNHSKALEMHEEVYELRKK